MSDKPRAISVFHPASLLVSVGGVGYIPFASGTFGSLAALPIAMLFFHMFAFPSPVIGLLAGVVFAAVIYVIGVKASEIYMARTGTHDPSVVVIDEVAGQVLALAIISPMLWGSDLSPEYRWIVLCCNFFLFRFFDIVKPWPVSWADQKLDGAHGVMLDDIFAGIYAGGLQFLLMLLLF